jgi:hypothetical protein
MLARGFFEAFSRRRNSMSKKEVSLADQLLPRRQFRERREAVVAAAPSAILAAVPGPSAAADPIVRSLLAIRYAPRRRGS